MNGQKENFYHKRDLGVTMYSSFLMCYIEWCLEKVSENDKNIFTKSHNVVIFLYAKYRILKWINSLIYWNYIWI
jgi:hypothetical protein